MSTAERHLRLLIRETIAGQGLPWGGVREDNDAEDTETDTSTEIDTDQET